MRRIHRPCDRELRIDGSFCWRQEMERSAQSEDIAAMEAR
jgi:hypothetical protein